ncbi:MAG TPA: nucleotidyltransferase [Candidatus Hydrogenedentes bacterium]|nr:nucleotidyltransferase [Candidatus Hydrogenedentota bacterium]HQE82410.1 nucleotidyltransferase [Candidatus Hydrogenedentota bacterium]HQH51053.1 nucleotidyltransferase [Candidatus Hydrogenedentota bacterium]HQM48775.1 nucleotidyltransferase [Candidatus Hydrogenedentota bacterium]
MALHPDLRAFIELLNSHGVDYVVVGAHAMAYHGCPRYTGDIDLFLRVSDENAQRMERVICAFGFKDTGLSARDFSEEHQIIQLGFPPNRIDLLTTLTGVPFDDAWSGAVSARLEGLPVRILSREHLIVNKKALGRAKDLADLEWLGGE